MLVVAAYVDQPRAARPCRFGKLGVVAKKLVHSGHYIEPVGNRIEYDRPPLFGHSAAGRGYAQQQGVGRRANRLPHGFVQGADDGQIAAHAQHLLARPAGGVLI